MKNSIPFNVKKIPGPVNQIQQGLTMDAKVRYLLVEAHEIANMAIEKHAFNDTSAVFCAEALVTSLLMGSQIKGDERFAVQLESTEPESRMICDLNSNGGVRIKWSPNTLPIVQSTKLNGILVTIKHNKVKELYRGATEIVNQTIANSLMHHLNQSSQITCIIKVAIEFSQGSFKRATGLLLEKYPESDDNPSASVEEFISEYSNLDSISDSEFLFQISQNTICGHTLFSLESKPIKWHCSCSDERIDTMLLSLGKDELHSILEDQGMIEIVCEFCSTIYHRDATSISELIKQIKS